MSLSGYVSESGLGNVVTANYFQVENGQSTVTVRQPFSQQNVFGVDG